MRFPLIIPSLEHAQPRHSPCCADRSKLKSSMITRHSSCWASLKGGALADRCVLKQPKP
jgi:hypothetical protein